MNQLRVLFVVSCSLAATCAIPNQSKSHLKPSQWLTPSTLEDIPALDEISFEKLEKMSVEEGAKLLQKWYHVSQINYPLIPSFIPSPSSIPVYIIEGDGKKETANLNNFVKVLKHDPKFGDEEITIFLTGLPSTMETVKKANSKLIQSYIERYNQTPEKIEGYKKNIEDIDGHTSKEDTFFERNNQKTSSGNLIVIDLGQTFNSLEYLAMLNVDETGIMIGKALLQLINDCDVPQEIIHVVAQGVAAHIAGAAGDEYTRLTGHKLRRITALDPSKVFAKNPQVLSGLARGDAEFIDAIHTSAYGMGILTSVGDIDFYPSGPCAGVPGAQNVVEASMRATRYFAETVYPGNEHNFPAVESNSLQQYKTNNGFGKRVFMGIATDYDLKGDYILQVNEKSPFGMRTPAQKQHTYQGVHQAWRLEKD